MWRPGQNTSAGESMGTRFGGQMGWRIAWYVILRDGLLGGNRSSRKKFFGMTHGKGECMFPRKE